MPCGPSPSKFAKQSSSPITLQPGFTPSLALTLPVKPSSLKHNQLGPHLEIKTANHGIPEEVSDGIALTETESFAASGEGCERVQKGSEHLEKENDEKAVQEGRRVETEKVREAKRKEAEMLSANEKEESEVFVQSEDLHPEELSVRVQSNSLPQKGASFEDRMNNIASEIFTECSLKSKKTIAKKSSGEDVKKTLKKVVFS